VEREQTPLLGRVDVPFSGLVAQRVRSLRMVRLSIEVRDSRGDLLVTADAESVLKL